MTSRRAMTLVELLVVIAILGTMTAISTVAIGNLDARGEPDASSEMLALKRDAVRARHAVTRLIAEDSLAVVVTALPDGRVATGAPITSTSTSRIGDAASR